MKNLGTLSLYDNRLTSPVVAGIIATLPVTDVLQQLDLSWNKLHTHACKALYDFLRKTNNLKYLNLTKAELVSEDLELIASSLANFNKSKLEELILNENSIASDGLQSLCKYLKAPDCTLQRLELSWNKLDSTSAAPLASAIAVNTSLNVLNLAVNVLKDAGGRLIASSLGLNQSLTKIDLSQNNIGFSSCFIFARVLKAHKSMLLLNLSHNPVGVSGARCIFRTILHGLKCFIRMENCEYRQDSHAFNHSNPAENSPYELDLSDPYDAAIFDELISMVENDPNNCKFKSITYRESSRHSPEPLRVGLAPLEGQSGGELIDKNTDEKYKIPSVGLVNIKLEYFVGMPTVDKCLSESAVNLMSTIVVSGRTELDKKNWLKIMSCDVYCTTVQAEKMIDILTKGTAIGPGGMTTLYFIEWFVLTKM